MASRIGKRTTLSWLCLTAYNLPCSLRLEKFSVGCIILGGVPLTASINYAKCLTEKCLIYNTFPLSLYINRHCITVIMWSST